MSLYEHILICWENGTIIGYSDIEKIKEIVAKYIKMYRKHEKELDKMFEEEKQMEIRKEKITDEFCERRNKLSNKCISETSINILENIASGKSYFEGSKGGLWICGCIANYTTTDVVLDELDNFFKELIDKNQLHGNIIGFGESEQSGEGKIYILDKNTMESREIKKEENWKWGLLFVGR